MVGGDRIGLEAFGEIARLGLGREGERQNQERERERRDHPLHGLHLAENRRSLLPLADAIPFCDGSRRNDHPGRGYNLRLDARGRSGRNRGASRPPYRPPLEGKERYVHSSPVELSRDESKPPARLLESKRRLLSDFDALFIRKDPPFNEDYLWMSLLLSGIPEGERPFVINRPMGLRNANEKLYATHFPEVTPRTLVTGRKDEILRFLEAEGGAAVIKPIDGHGGEGVFKLASDDPNKNAIIEALTRNERRQVMVQEFLPEVKEGDKRILLIGDETLGAILRVP